MFILYKGNKEPTLIKILYKTFNIFLKEKDITTVHIAYSFWHETKFKQRNTVF